MNTFVKTLVFFLSVATFSPIMALGTTTTSLNPNPEPPLMIFQVIQNQLVFDSSAIENATMVPPETSADSYGLKLKLSSSATKEFSKLTENSIDKRGNFILQGVLISSPIIRTKIGSEFLLTGLTKEQADLFIKNLKASAK
jgi:preprotein translocase subunit SecD